jgi:GT2 family glycosyltransferase
MNFWQIFLRVLPWRPAAALAAAWYQITRRRVRARNRLRVAGSSLPFAYDIWMRNIERQEAVARGAALACDAEEIATRFTIIVDNRRANPPALDCSLESIREQSAGLCTEIMIYGATGDECASLEQALRASAGEFIIVLRAGCRLARNALFLLSQAISAAGDAALFFGDEDRVDAQGLRWSPWFKPAWNRELYLAMDYVSGACAIRTGAARRAVDAFGPDEVSVPALILHIADAGAHIVHLPHVLVHREAAPEASSLDHAKAVATVVAGGGGRTCCGPYETVRVSWPLPAENRPLVSIIIPTRDKVELLRTCVETLLDRTKYAPIEVIIVDNGSEQAATKRFLRAIVADPRVRVLAAPGPYNYSALNNEAAASARGEFLCLLNNDTEIIDGDWLDEMMRYAVRTEVGAVGAKLLYADRSIQHAGVVVGIGDAAGHAHRYLPEGDAGYFRLPHATHYVTAVTGACLLVDRTKFDSVGGLDAQCFAVAYNDVDLCMKLEQAGWRNVYVPHAVLIHHESKSRGKDHAPDQIDRYRGELRRFQKRWNVAGYRDPLLNPNLDRSNETFVIRF